MVRFLAAVMAFFAVLSEPVLSAPMTLSQKDVAERVLQDSGRAAEVNFKYEQTRLKLAEILKNYDFAFSGGYYYQLSKIPNFANTNNTQDENYVTSLSFKKPLETGTTLEFSFNNNTQISEYGRTTTLPSQQTLDTFGITLTQNLWRNSFGRADRALVRSAETSYQSGQTARADELEGLVLEAIRLYWKAYVAQENFQESLNSRDRYQKLVETVRRKTSYGYSNPGELSQVQAELEGRIQKVKQASTDYLATMDQLVTYLQLPPGTEIKFVVTDQIPPLPQLPEVETEKLRALRAQKLALQAADDALIASSSTGYPDLSLVGKYYQAGLDASSDTAYNQMLGSSHPQYYVGLQFSYNFGSGYQNEELYNRQVSRNLAQAVLTRTSLETKDSLANAQRKVQSSYAIALSAKAQVGYREKAAQDLNRSYNQGRTSIMDLITALNNYFDSETQYSKAIGDYQTALNEWAAARDELIPDVKK